VSCSSYNCGGPCWRGIWGENCWIWVRIISGYLDFVIICFPLCSLEVLQAHNLCLYYNKCIIVTQ
jgi:hypothetical protein